MSANLPRAQLSERCSDGGNGSGNGSGSGARRSPLVEALAGLTAGSAATLALHPLDIVKTRMQSRSSAPPTTLSILGGLARSPRPVAALYRGLTPNLLGNASGWASFFFFKTRIERALAGTTTTTDRQGGGGGSPSPAEFFLASALAGAITTLLTNPIWVLKTRLLSTDRAAAGAYPGFATGCARLWRDEGWAGFYRGVGVSLLGVLHGAVQFAVYEPAKRLYLGRDGDAEKRVGNGATLVLSTVAKLAAGAVTYPYQVVRSRLQNHEAEARFGRGIRGVVARLWRQEGARGFYRGLVPGLARVMPATWVTFLVYENMRFYVGDKL